MRGSHSSFSVAFLFARPTAIAAAGAIAARGNVACDENLNKMKKRREFNDTETKTKFVNKNGGEGNAALATTVGDVDGNGVERVFGGEGIA